MKNQLKLFLFAIFMSCNLFGQNVYQNPIIPGFHPDPSICRVGDDYFLVTSSFEYFPGVPIFHSKDLTNWQQIGHCLTRESQLPLGSIDASMGIFAPTIRYHEGFYYMVTTNVTKGGNFYVYTTDPYGEWSDPIYLDQPGIDPSFYFEDGKCYFASTSDGIQLVEIDIKTGKKLAESVHIWQGTGGRYPEGPHIYKKDDWYYLLISEGGTEYGHKVTIARSKSIYGPYESNPANPILTHINENAQTNPIQGTGHADFIQAADGSWWVVFLAFRPQDGTHHLLGRETFLAPVTWEEGEWPIINNNQPVELVMDRKNVPLHPLEQPLEKTYFEELSYEWNYLRNPDMSKYSWGEGKGLKLKATPIGLNEKASPTFLARRQQHIHFQATTPLKLSEASVNDEAGITVFMRNNYHYDLAIRKDRDGRSNLILRYCLGEMNHIEKEIPLSSDSAYLRVEGDNEFYHFSYSEDGQDFRTIGKMNTRLLSTETAGGFTGIMLGLYAVSGEPASNGIAEIEWFEYIPGN